MKIERLAEIGRDLQLDYAGSTVSFYRDGDKYVFVLSHPKEYDDLIIVYDLDGKMLASYFEKPNLSIPISL